jgi:hypothetical protein
MRLSVPVVVIGLLWPGCAFSQGVAAHAETDAATILKQYDEANPTLKQYLEERISDIESGMHWANNEIIRRKGTPVCCLPEHLVLTGAQLFDILRRQTGAMPSAYTNYPFPLVLLYGLEENFPCQTKP